MGYSLWGCEESDATERLTTTQQKVGQTAGFANEGSWRGGDQRAIGQGPFP